VIEVRVAHEHAEHPAGRPQPSRKRSLVSQRRAPSQQLAKAHPRDVGIDVDRLALVGEPIAGHTQPFDFQTACQAQRAGCASGQLLKAGLVGDRAPEVLDGEAGEA
jgi:hypothetical protein